MRVERSQEQAACDSRELLQPTGHLPELSTCRLVLDPKYSFDSLNPLIACAKPGAWILQRESSLSAGPLNAELIVRRDEETNPLVPPISSAPHLSLCPSHRERQSTG